MKTIPCVRLTLPSTMDCNRYYLSTVFRYSSGAIDFGQSMEWRRTVPTKQCLSHDEVNQIINFVLSNRYYAPLRRGSLTGIPVPIAYAADHYYFNHYQQVKSVDYAPVLVYD